MHVHAFNFVKLKPRNRHREFPIDVHRSFFSRLCVPREVLIRVELRMALPRPTRHGRFPEASQSISQEIFSLIFGSRHTPSIFHLVEKSFHLLRYLGVLAQPVNQPIQLLRTHTPPGYPLFVTTNVQQ